MNKFKLYKIRQLDPNFPANPDYEERRKTYIGKKFRVIIMGAKRQAFTASAPYVHFNFSELEEVQNNIVLR